MTWQQWKTMRWKTSGFKTTGPYQRTNTGCWKDCCIRPWRWDCSLAKIFLLTQEVLLRVLSKQNSRDHSIDHQFIGKDDFGWIKFRNIHFFHFQSTVCTIIIVKKHLNRSATVTVHINQVTTSTSTVRQTPSRTLCCLSGTQRPLIGSKPGDFKANSYRIKAR